MNRHVALKGKNDLTQYLDSTCSKHRCENKALFSTFEIGEMESLLLEMPLAPILGKGIVEISGFPTFQMFSMWKI